MYESSVADTVSHFTAHGYTGGLRAENGELRDVVTGRTYRPEQLRIDDLVRFEGESDPGDSAVVFALSDFEGVKRGIYIVAFGPQMDRLDVKVVRRLSDARPTTRRRAGAPDEDDR